VLQDHPQLKILSYALKHYTQVSHHHISALDQHNMRGLMTCLSEGQ
jgi:hypothetical protein